MSRLGSLFAGLKAHLALGTFVGALYTGLDAYLDRSIGTALSSPPRPVELLHALIDLVLPIVTGALLGVLGHYLHVRERMADLERARADELALNLKRIERDQAVWVLSASLLHELKNPLHALGLLLDEVRELPPEAEEERQTLLERAHSQSDRLVSQLRALRTFPEAPKRDSPSSELHRAVELALQPIETRTRRRGVQLELAGPPVQAHFQPAYLRIILENLVDNALEALPQRNEGGRIRLETFVAAQHVGLRVQDNGPGLPIEALPHLFEPLRTTKEQGLGLGLSIARGLCRAMGGDLVALAEPGGACFEVRLAAAEGQSPA
jgi:signal transduction histidine kinase